MLRYGRPYMKTYEQLRAKLKEATYRNRADSILLSGGLDTSILAFLARPATAFTAALKDARAPDLAYSDKVAKLLGIEHKKIEYTAQEALNALPQVIRILRTFDLALPNDLSLYFALGRAREYDVRSIMTGDGSDELFAGYSYMADLSPRDLDRYLRRLSGSWHFSANELGRALGIQIEQPFLDKGFVSFALDISPRLKVSQGTGKYILRKSFEGLISSELLWRGKDAIEYGAGSTELRQVMSDGVSDKDFEAAARRTGIRFINKEHYAYYRIYSEVVGEIPKAGHSEASCPCCGAQLDTSHCGICGFSQPLEQYLLTVR
jgi:asparagine synthase (glutamine-hydrolysing)